MEKELVCICCPVGCMLTVNGQEGGELEVTGNGCNRGAEYARKEVINPTRMVTSTVRVKNGKQAVVSVKTREAIPKEKINACMEVLKTIETEAPVLIGAVIAANVAETGVDVIATKEVEKI